MPKFSRLPTRRPVKPPEPQIQVLPHISAPIDEGPLIPPPPRSLGQKIAIGALFVFLAILGLSYAFTHATLMR